MFSLSLAAVMKVAPAHVPLPSQSLWSATSSAEAEPLTQRGLRFAREQYLPLACFQMALVRGTADIVCQSHQLLPLNTAHVVAMAASGAVISGAGGALWLRHLERRLGPCRGPRNVLLKSGADFTCWAPTVITLNLLCVSLMTGHSLEDSFETAQIHLPQLLLLEALIFTPYNLCQFTHIPAEMRPSVKACCSFLFSIGIGLSC
mmetsp:Transcript_18754/g.60915  ORF Transcript_18754/g.60915 Transcript_18754/m.60915 type:complete len:204 (-) Transcript_18754:133-744(-)